MSIVCTTHGPTPCVLISPDLTANKHTPESYRALNILHYASVYLGEIAFGAYLSSGFMSENQLTLSDIGIEALQDDFPDWTKQCVPQCSKCFFELIHPIHA